MYKRQGLEITDTIDTQFYCNCSKERVEQAVVSVGRKEIQEMINEGETIEVKCQFCNTAYHYTVEDLKRIIKLPVDGKGYPHKNQRVLSLRMFCDLMQRFSCIPKQHLLSKEIPAGISGNTKLRKYHDFCAGRCRLIDLPANTFCIILYVRNPDIRCV